MSEKENMNRSEKGKERGWFTTRAMTVIAILAALSSVLFYFPEFPVPFMPGWMKLDLSNLPAMIGTFALGPWAGLIIVTVKDLVGLTHSTSGGIGELADFVMSAAFVIPAGLLYWHGKNRRGALMGMAAGTAVMIAAGSLTNYYVLIPAFAALMGVSVDEILVAAAAAVPIAESLTLGTYMLWVVVPFNLFKGALISLVTLLIYKPLSPVLHGSHGCAG
ncbi:MAG: ECF transporter S component [Clostridiales bacterium]|nr:ECF transporter S component [Clostridiales bacterium]